jgi:hypothetical protein
VNKTTILNERACQACELYKAYWFTNAVKLGIDTDIAREMAQAVSTAWTAGYNYRAMNGGRDERNNMSALISVF